MLSNDSCSGVQHRSPQQVPRQVSPQLNEEKLCDQIAAELLMPQSSFKHTAHLHNWEIDSIIELAELFQTSMTATAIRFLDLVPEPSVLISWHPSTYSGGRLSATWHKQNPLCGPTKFYFSAQIMHRKEQVVGNAFDTNHSCRGLLTLAGVINGQAYYQPLYTEAIGVGKGKYRRVITLSYPNRKSSLQSY